MKVNKDDFVEVEYTGRIKSDGRIFDTTNEKLAEENKIKTPGMAYGPIIVCLGENNIVEFLDDELADKEIGKKYEKEFRSEEAFGKKDAKLVRVVSMNLFKKQDMAPYPGMQINAEGHFGIVRSISGGRVIVDFNHPLAGRELIYEFRILSKINDAVKQAECIAKFNLLPNKNLYELKLDGESLNVVVKIDIPDKIKETFKKKIQKLVPKIKKIEFSTEKKDEKQITTQE